MARETGRTLGPYASKAGVCVLLCLAACAEPRAPTGGPRDTTPPALISSIPENETVNFAGSSLTLEFSEYVDEAAFGRAYSITPTPTDPPTFRWKRHRVTIRYDEPFRDSTTYVIALGTDLRDARGVRLRHPITLAFSTGDVIDQGNLRGRVVSPTLGTGADGFDVLAYVVQGDSLPEVPTYRTQSGEDGSFALSYVQERPYFVIALQDRNRNQRADVGELFASPPVAALNATPDTLGVRQNWVVTQLDTIAPRIDRIRPISSSRIQVRFTEPVALSFDRPPAWQLSDSLTGETVAIRSQYMQPGSAREIYLRTDALGDRTYALAPDLSIADSSGNSVERIPRYFDGSARPDTIALRFAGFIPSDSVEAASLPPRTSIQVQFTEALHNIDLAGLVTAEDTTGAPREVLGTTMTGTTYSLAFAPPLLAGDGIFVQVQDSSDGATHRKWFARMEQRALGSLSGFVRLDSLPVPLVVELLSEEARTLAATTADSVGAFAFEDLPEGEYFVRAYLDANSNGQWDGGQVFPYHAPEPITWLEEPERVRARWDTALPDTIRLPVYR